MKFLDSNRIMYFELVKKDSKELWSLSEIVWREAIK